MLHWFYVALLTQPKLMGSNDEFTFFLSSSGWQILLMICMQTP